ncbi:MAG: DUF448 domain-containing protein [Alphaproteobacteria bacterium]|nr:DUF448 domain-containing protein [Alphaproteobacteria bacterium]
MKKNEDITRKCIVTGEIKDKSQLLRFVLTPEKQVVPDLYKKLPGKGIYVSNSYALLKQAIEKNIFAKVLKKNVKLNKELLQMVENILHKNALNAISLAKKSGIAVISLEKVLAALKENKLAFLLEAEDAGQDGLKKLQNYTSDLSVYRLFKVEDLDKVLDKINTVYIGFLREEMSMMVKNNFDRLSSFLQDKCEGENI